MAKKSIKKTSKGGKIGKEIKSKKLGSVPVCPCGKGHERRSPYCSKACYERYDSHGSFARAKAKKGTE